MKSMLVNIPLWIYTQNSCRQKIKIALQKIVLVKIENNIYFLSKVGKFLSA